MTSLELQLQLQSLSSHAELLLWYSVKIGDVFLPGCPVRLLPLNAIAAQYPFILALSDQERAVEATKDICRSLRESVISHEGNWFPQVSSELAAAVRDLPLNLLEKKLDDSIGRGALAVFSLADQYSQQPRGEDPLFRKFLDRLRWKRETATKSARDWPGKLLEISRAYSVAEREPLNEEAGKYRLAELAGELVGFREPVTAASGGVCFSCAPVLPHKNLTFRFICWSSELNATEQVEHFRLADADKMNTIYVIILMGLDLVTPRHLRVFYDAEVVLLKAADIVRHFVSTDNRCSLRAAVMNQLKLRLLSPYGYDGPTRIFLGRKSELSQIVQDQERHFCVVGPRKIGKTSLSERLARECARGRTIVVKVECSTASMRLSHFQETLLHEFCNAVRERGGNTNLDAIWPGDEFFSQLQLRIAELARDGFRILFLIDEVDDVLRLPQIYAFESFCRTLGNRRHAQFVVFGFSVFTQRINDRKSAFHNFFQEIVLGPLDNVAAKELVLNPMGEMNVTVDSPVVDEIVDRCSRMPHLIQAMCRELTLRDEVEKSRRITFSDVDAVYSHANFTDVLLQPIIGDGSMQELHLLLVLLLAKGLGTTAALGCCREQDYFDFFSKRLPQISTSEISRALNQLRTTFVLRLSGDQYRFFVEEQRRRLVQSRDVAAWVERLVDELLVEHRR